MERERGERSEKSDVHILNVYQLKSTCLEFAVEIIIALCMCYASETSERKIAKKDRRHRFAGTLCVFVINGTNSPRDNAIVEYR